MKFFLTYRMRVASYKHTFKCTSIKPEIEPNNVLLQKQLTHFNVINFLKDYFM